MGKPIPGESPPKASVGLNNFLQISTDPSLILSLISILKNCCEITLKWSEILRNLCFLVLLRSWKC